MRHLIVAALSITFLFSCVVVTTAWAGTKFQTNIVPATDTHPTLNSKGKLQVKDTGKLSVKLDGVTDPNGALVTTDGSFSGGTITGDEYVTVLTGTFVALGVEFSLNLISEMKAGKGNGKIDATFLFGLLPSGLLRSVDMGRAEVWGPIGDQVCDLGTNTCQGGAACATNADCPTVTDCQNSLVNGFVVTPSPNPCVGGTKIGVGGISLP